MASDDPDFERTAADIIGLYLNPPRHAAIFRLDETSPRVGGSIQSRPPPHHRSRRFLEFLFESGFVDRGDD